MGTTLVRRGVARFATAALIATASVVALFTGSAPVLAADLDAAPFSLSPPALQATAASVQVPDSAGVSVLRSEETYRIGADGRTQYVYYTVYRILNAAGADGWHEIAAYWSPWKDRRPELRARVIAADGREYTLDPKTIVDAPVSQGTDSVYSDARMLRAPLPAIGPGAVVESEVVADDGPALDGVGTVRRTRFQLSEPVQRFRVTVRAPRSVTLRHRADLLPDMRVSRTESGEEVQWTFEAGPVPAIGDIDEGLPREVHAVPVLTFSTGSSWRQLAERYSRVVDERIAQSDVTALAERLTRGRDSRESKIEAVVEYLNREIRYTGIEFDEAAIVPRAPAETLRFRYGDCKDKATLLVALLRAAGIPANVALLSVGVRVDPPEDQPGLGLFDHAIVQVPGTPDLWIDATADTSRLGQLPPGSADRLVLVAHPETTALVRTPALRSSENVIYEERTFRLAEHGPGQVVEVSRPRGVYEADYRATFADLNRKERRDGLVDYVKSHYGAERLTRAERSDPRDFSTPFSLTLEGAKVSRAYTRLADATVYLRLGPLFERLPDDLQKREPTEQENARATRPRAKRTADYRLDRPHAVEFRYTLVPPAGFEPTAVPESSARDIGPARLEQSYSTDAEGAVHATLRFDTMKSRFTPAETIALRNAVAEVLAADAPRVRFELSASVLATRGEARRSFEAYRALVTRSPNSAIAHVRRAEGLLLAGMGEGARAAARRAVQIDPRSAAAQAELARVLQHDLIGREYAEGADRAGAAAAWRAAAAADPDEKSYVVNLAILLEFDDRGVRYGPRADLAGAIAEYRRLTQEDLADLDSQYNLPFALLYSRQFEEAKRVALALNTPAVNVAIAAEAMLTDSARALAEARRLAGSEANRRESLRAAGYFLMNLREYGRAAPLIEASAAGESAAQMLNLAATLRNTQRMETLPPTTSVEEMTRRLAARIANSSFTLDAYAGLLSRTARIVDAAATREQRDRVLQASRSMQHMAVASNMIPDALADIAFRTIQANAFGADATGYRVSLLAPGQSAPSELLVVKEDGEYRILASGDEPAPVGLEVLDRLSRGDLAGARALLDLMREVDKRTPGEDPYAQGPFRLLWSGATADADATRATTAAAVLLSNSKFGAARAAKLLEEARSRAGSDAERDHLDLALLNAYFRLDDNARALVAATSLAERAPDSRIAFEARIRALVMLGRGKEADALSEARLSRLPRDVVALRSLARAAMNRADYADSQAKWRTVLASGHAEGTDYNEVAWTSLFIDRAEGPDLDSAGRATQLQPRAWPFLHTLGCVYAEIGRTKEARDILMNALTISGLGEPNGNFWYAFGRLAEYVGETGIARAYYDKVDAPEEPAARPGSSWKLAQRRIAIMQGKPADAAGGGAATRESARAAGR